MDLQSELERAGARRLLARAGAYPLPLEDGAPAEADWRPLVRAVMDDRRRGTTPATVSARLHNALAAHAAETALRAGNERVVLTGGCFQNPVLEAVVRRRLRAPERRRDRGRTARRGGGSAERGAREGGSVMCLGVPGRILEVRPESRPRTGRVDFEGVVKEVCLELVPEAVPGDYVIVHVGFAISRVDEDEAKQVFRYLEEIGELGEEAGREAEAEERPR
jgi:hydrogenase expression/formation protein HypC